MSKKLIFIQAQLVTYLFIVAQILLSSFETTLSIDGMANNTNLSSDSLKSISQFEK